MKTLAIICAAIGGVTALGVTLFALYVMSSGEPEGFVFAVFVAVVVGIPAAGFTMLMLSISGVFLVAGNAVDERAVPSSNGDPVSSRQAAEKRKWLLRLSFGLFGGAILWSVPYGFVHFVTGHPDRAFDTAVTWLSVAGPLCAGGFLAQSAARNPLNGKPAFPKE